MTENKNEYWNKEEKILGLLGVAPYATIDFLNKISDLTPAKKDWDHIRIILDNNVKIPSRGRALELNEESPVKYMRDTIRGLNKAGADFVILLCNTAHIFYDEVADGLGVEVLNMITETLNHLLENNKEINSIGILGSNNTVKYKLYEKYCPPKAKLSIHYPIEHQKMVANIIESVKQGGYSKELKSHVIQISELLNKNCNLEGMIIGCTEISSLIKNGDLSIPVYDSNEILAKAAISKIKTIK